jgi:hypothetical protein
VAAMVDTNGSPELCGSSVFYHRSARDRYQSNEEDNANSITRFRKTTTNRGRIAAREGGGTIAGSLELRKHVTQSTTTQKKSMGRKRRRWRAHQNGKRTPIHPQTPTTSNSYSLGLPISYARFHAIRLGF